MRRFICALMMLMSLSACALGNEAAREIRLTVIPLEVTEEAFGMAIESTEDLDATDTPTPTMRAVTSVPQPTNTATSANIRNTSNCSVRTDLPTYIVAAGDTLSNIASRYNTTANQLSQFNCLNDANLISVGMSLRVPIPPTATPSLTPIPSPSVQVSWTPSDIGIRGTLGAFPVIESGNPSNWIDYVLEPQTPFTINWTGIEPEYHNLVTEATFGYVPDGSDAVQIIGKDTNISDGIAITWTPPAGVSGTIQASARLSNNTFFRSSTLHVRDS